MENFELAIGSWVAYGPGLTTPSQWQAWGLRPFLPSGSDPPELLEMAPMARRRLGPLGRMASWVAYSAQGSERNMPVVWSTRYGDAARSLELLAELARDQAISPTAFGLSVHNAIGAVYSIARGDHSNYISVAGGSATAAAGWIEAAGLLAEGAPEVLLVCYDAPLPGAYVEYEDEPAACYAWAWRLSLPKAGEPTLRLTMGSADNNAAFSKPDLPFGLDVLRFFLAGDSVLQHAVGNTMWVWQRRA